MDNEKTIYEDLGEQAALTSEGLSSQNFGSTERLNESKIYSEQVKSILDCERLTIERELNESKIELERYKTERELELKEEYDKAKLAIEEANSKREKRMNIAKLCLTGLELGLTSVFGVLYLKANMEYGGMVGKDGKGWFEQIKHIKL